MFGFDINKLTRWLAIAGAVALVVLWLALQS